jgi:hypothetical protein
MDGLDLLGWFERNELEPCERCGEQAGLRIEESETFICFGCGYIRWRGGETSVDALQAPSAGGTVTESPILELLEQHGPLANEQIAAHLDKPAVAVRTGLASLRDRGLVEVVPMGDAEGHSADVGGYWRLTEAGRQELARRGPRNTAS